MKSIIRNQLRIRKESGPLSREQIRAEANIGVNFLSTIKAWASIAKQMDNKNHYNHFAKEVLKQIEEYNEIIIGEE